MSGLLVYLDTLISLFIKKITMNPNQKPKKTSFIPRSIVDTIDRLKQTLDPNAESKILEEFRANRRITVTSIRYLLILITIPILINQLSKPLIINPLIHKFWSQEASRIFINSSQELKALTELKKFEKHIKFESLLGKSLESPKLVEEKIAEKAISLAKKYKSESIDAIANIFADMISLATFTILIIIGKQQLGTVKELINNIFYGISDSGKAFIIILLTDIFVGYHSPFGWEIILENTLKHFGLPEQKSLISLFIATVPVVMDSIFKYWIFRYLNRSSPSAVATYHSMND